MQFVQIYPDSPLLNLAGGLPIISPVLLNQHRPNAHWLLLHDRAVVGHCSLWWSAENALGMIGHYNVQDEAAAALLLDRACEELAAQGCKQVIAPIDGNTWRSHRLVTQQGTEPPFFLEPNPPLTWVADFEQAGFTPIAHYYSALNTNLSYTDPQVSRIAERLYRTGIVTRSIDLSHFETELKRIHALSLGSFRQNFLYESIALKEFVAQYRPVQEFLQPDLVRLAEHKGTLVGFLFAVPDLLQAQWAEPNDLRRAGVIDTVIIKTVAVQPGRRYAGLGNLLVAEVQTIAAKLGYRRAIHALMHQNNSSRNLSCRYAQPMREYALFGRSLVK